MSEEAIIETPSPEVLEEIKRQEIITKVKVIAFDSIGKDPLFNGSHLYDKEKERAIEKMKELLKLSEEDIDKLFKEICNEKIFIKDRDYTTLPVYSL
jgi:hypothetical protein